MKKLTVYLLLTTIICYNTNSQQLKETTLKGKLVLLFTKNGKGYIHENIPSSITAIQKMGKDYNFKVDKTTNSVLFTDDNLKKYDALIFSNTNNDVL